MYANLFSLVFLLVQLHACRAQIGYANLTELLIFNKIIPRIIGESPIHLAKIFKEYPRFPRTLIELKTDEKITAPSMSKAPFVRWPARPNTNFTMYCLATTLTEKERFWDKGVTPREWAGKGIPPLEQWDHWIKINIPSNNSTCGGDTVLEYKPIEIPRTTRERPHYVFLIYEQTEPITIDPKDAKKFNERKRELYHRMDNFTAKYKLGKLWAACYITVWIKPKILGDYD